MRVKCYSKRGNEVGSVEVLDSSKKGQRCVRYEDYKSNKGGNKNG